MCFGAISLGFSIRAGPLPWMFIMFISRRLPPDENNNNNMTKTMMMTLQRRNWCVKMWLWCNFTLVFCVFLCVLWKIRDVGLVLSTLPQCLSSAPFLSLSRDGFGFCKSFLHFYISSYFKAHTISSHISQCNHVILRFRCYKKFLHFHLISSAPSCLHFPDSPICKCPTK